MPPNLRLPDYTMNKIAKQTIGLLFLFRKIFCYNPLVKDITIKGKTYEFPIYLPDATRALVKSLDSVDLRNTHVKGAVVNTYHLMTDPGTEVIKKFGGIKNFMNFEGLVTSDSGGWQVFSLIHRSGKKGKITDDGVVFSVGGGKNTLFTPQKSIQVQFDIGSDIIICLDDFTPPNSTYDQNLDSVERTTKWAKLCKDEYNKQIEERGMEDDNRPLVFAVIQGHLDKELRKKSANDLIEIGFDGYGYGGYVIDANGNLDLEISKYIANLIPEGKIRFALGVGTSWDIAALYDMGWHIFDCTLPTRDARHKRLYTFKKEPKNIKELKNRETYEYIYINKSKYIGDRNPIEDGCDCLTCTNYSRSYLRHLFYIGDSSAFRLASIHNLRHYTRLTEYLKKFSQNKNS